MVLPPTMVWPFILTDHVRCRPIFFIFILLAFCLTRIFFNYFTQSKPLRLLLSFREYGNKKRHYYGERIINEKGLRIYNITIEIVKF